VSVDGHKKRKIGKRGDARVTQKNTKKMNAKIHKKSKQRGENFGSGPGGGNRSFIIKKKGRCAKKGTDATLPQSKGEKG